MPKARKKPAIEPIDRLMLPEEVAEILRCAVGTLANWRNDKKGPAYIKMGGMIRYRESDIKKYQLENYETPF